MIYYGTSGHFTLTVTPDDMFELAIDLLKEMFSWE